uniref:Uncharacterized protein n=1 Tax=Myoviridae sp. ctZgq1 TaxID=2826666 RepID=A0A8S5LXM5_9CAUD|nr:MAG TPA: hypothetical protein [Myoviridae sp. ctZgq1]
MYFTCIYTLTYSLPRFFIILAIFAENLNFEQNPYF